MKLYGIVYAIFIASGRGYTWIKVSLRNLIYIIMLVEASQLAITNMLKVTLAE